MTGVSPQDVFAVLRNPYSYGHWVVGTRTIRKADDGWPEPGTSLHYTVGYGPLRKDDRTRSLRYVPDAELELEAIAWPAGTARILLTATSTADGTEVVLHETPARGVARTVHNCAFDLALRARNVETLRRLEQLARRQRSHAG